MNASIGVISVDARNYFLQRHDIETWSALLALCEGNQRTPVDSSHKGNADF